MNIRKMSVKNLVNSLEKRYLNCISAPNATIYKEYCHPCEFKGTVRQVFYMLYVQEVLSVSILSVQEVHDKKKREKLALTLSSSKESLEKKFKKKSFYSSLHSLFLSRPLSLTLFSLLLYTNLSRLPGQTVLSENKGL